MSSYNTSMVVLYIIVNYAVNLKKKLLFSLCYEGIKYTKRQLFEKCHLKD